MRTEDSFVRQREMNSRDLRDEFRDLPLFVNDEPEQNTAQYSRIDANLVDVPLKANRVYRSLAPP